MILKLFVCLRQLADVEGGVLNDSPKFDKLTLTVVKFMSSEKNLKIFFISASTWQSLLAEAYHSKRT